MNRITFTHTQPGSGRRIIGKALSLALSLLLIIGLVPAVALNRQEIPADQSGTPNAQAQAPSAQAPSAQTQIEGTGGDLDTPYQEDNNTSGSNEKTGEANVSDEPAIVVNPQGAAPIAPRAPYQSPNVLQVIPSTATTLLSGHSAIASFAITNNAPRGWVLAVPVPDPQNSGSYTVVLGSAYGIDTTHVGPLAQPLDEKFGPLQGRTDVLLIWGTATATYFSVKFTYPSGTTPSGTQLTLDAYLFEASYISGAPSGIVEANTAIAPTDLAGSPTPPLTFTWDTNEELSITKSVTAPTPDPAFSTLQTRTYSQVANPGAENTYTTSYRVNVATTGSDDYGRVWMDELHIRDNLAGYLNGTSQTPQSIVVKNSAGLVVASTTGQGSPIALNSNSTVFDIALPMAQGTAISGTYFDVDITWDKNAYTKTYFNNTYEAGVVTVDNTATLYSKPVFAQAPSPVDEASAAISLGWQQAAPVPAQLTVNKRLGVSGSIFAYTTALATAYERDYGNPSYNNGDTSCVEFTLTDANNAVLSKHLILGETNSAVTFGVAADGDFNATHDGLPPGTYTLAETGGTSANVPANPLSVYTIVVSVPNPTTGVSTISVAGPNNTAADFNSGTNTLNFINTATQTGRIKITARTQNRWSAPATYTPQAGAAFNLLDSSNNIIASGTSDASGNIIFEDVPTTGSYHLAEATPLGSDYLLDVANSTLTNIASSVDKLETYTVTYQRNEGSLYVGKYFKGPDGAQIPSNTVGAFEATFHLVYADGAKQGEELPNSSFTISGTSQTATILANKVFPQGSYYIVEDSIKVSGTTYSATSPDAPYSLITLADGVKVDIIAGAYDNVPYDANVTDGKNMVVTDGPTGGALLVNSATWSELAIDSRFFSDSGSSPLTYPDAFTITNRADSSISYDIPANSSNWINGVYRLLVPAGTYDVAVKNPSDTPNIKTIASLGNQAAQGTSDSVSIKVEPGSVALANAIVAINNGTGTTSISYDGCANTAVFVQAYVPSVSITKLRADTNTSLSGAGFTLYRLVGTEYVKTTITATSTTSTTNNVSFANLIAGTYVAVETSIPAGYYGTVDASVFKDSVTNGFFDHVSAATVDSIADLTKFVVQQSDYAQTAQTSLAKGNAITSSTNPDTMANKIVRNVPTYTINARALDAATGSEQGSNKTTNAVFQLYQNNATNTAPNWVLVGTATYKNSAAVIFTTEGTTPVALTPGDYKVVQSVSPQPAQNGGEYIITGETAYFTVDSNGKAGTTNWTLPGKADSSTAQISWSSLSTNASTKIVSVVFGQVKKPIIEFQKYGETNQLIGNKRVTAPIQGGTFKIYSYDNGDPDTGTKVYLAQDFVAQGSNKLGWLDIPALDPTKTYYLAETATPPYQTDVPEDEPTAVQYKKIKDIKFWFELNSAKTAWEPHVFGADSGGFSSEVSSLGTGKYKIVNHVDPYFIHITKLPIKPTTDGTITPNSDEFTIDAKSGERDADGNPRWQEILVANARFALYLLDENGNKIDSDLSKDGIQPIQYISSATGGEHSQNDAWSMQLPPGTYWVEEIASALNYGQIGTPLDPTETSSVYFNETASGMGEANGGDPTVPDWHAIIKGDKGYGVQITIPDLSANEDIDDEDRTYELFLGNSNRLDTGRAGINPPTWIQVHAWKNGASRLPYGGTTPYKMKYDEDKNTWVEDVTNDAGRLANVRFSLYPALFIGDPDNVAEIQDISNYIQLPTFNNTPLDDLRSSRWGSMDSQWINVTSVFRGIVSGLDDSLTITSDAVSSEDTDTSRVDWTSFFSNGQNSQYKQQAAALAEGNPENGWAVVWLENPSSLPPVFQTEVSSTPFVAHASVVFGTYGLIDQKYDTVNKNAYGSNVNHESPDTAKTPEIVNTRGIATLQVDKVELGNANNKVAGATFALYRADNSAIEAIYAAHPGAWNASGVNGVAAVKAGFTPVPDGNGGYTGLTYIDTLTTGADGTIAHSGLKPGYYYLVETTSGSNALNTYGEYSINYPERKVPEVTGPNVLPADVSAAAYGMGSAGSPTLIGPIELSDLNFPSFRVVAQGKPKPSIYVRNYWNGNLLYDSDYTATYKLTPAVDQANSYTATSANAETIQCLADGTYTLTLDRLSDTAAAYYGCNADAQDNKISLTITGAQISAVKIANQSAPLIADGNIWLTGAVWNSAKGYYEPETAGAQITLNVNQPAQGALIIRKGGLVDGVLKNYTGTTGTSAVPTNLNKADFELQVYSNDTWISASNEGTNGTIIWSAATHASTGVIESLPAGSYRVKEIGVDPTDSWYVETATGADWVYFDILPSGGAVYLSNLSRLGGAGTEKTPLQSSKNSAEKWFYNTSTQGTLGVWKLNGSGSTTNITGATFELYPTADGTAPSGSKVATLTSNATTYYTYDSGVTTRAESNSGNYYKATVRAGDYLLKEVIAPNGYALRTSFVPVTVVGGQSGIAAGNFNGYANSANINSVGFLDPPATTLSVKKLADYPAIMLGGQEIVAAHTEVIPGLPFTLYKYTGPVDGAAGHNNQADFTKQAEQTTWPGATSGSNERGVAKFSITEEGEYRIVEESLGAGHEFLGYNPDFQSKDGKLGNAPSIFASYDATTNKLVVTTQDSTTNAGSTWNAVNNELAVKNPFVGFQVAARKIDYLSDNPLAGATFSLYATEADAKANTNKVSLGGRTQTFTTDASGIVLFDPFFLNVNENSRSYWIREDSVPTDYAIDEWYDARIKQVTVARGGSATASASFSNGLKGPDPSDLNLALEKTTGTLNPADKTLVQSAVDTTYTLKTPGGSLGNQLPLYNFTISDTGIIFKGGNPLTKIVDSAIQPGNLPSYHIKEVRVGPSYSYASAADKKHGADKLSAVWANVNNLGWKRLDQTQAWTLANPGDQSFSVIYSTMDPSNTQVTDVYGKTVGDPASGYWVGSEFTAGNISYDVTFNTFTPKSDQPEVSQAVNTANVALDKARGDKTRVSRSDDATIDWTIAERPKMLVQTTLDAAYGHDANGEIDTNRPKNIGGQPAPEAGDYFDYTLMLKNASPNALDLSYPILIDYLEPDAMTLDSYEVTLPDGTTSTDLGAQFENKSAYLVWQFPSVVLAQNDTVSIKVRFKLNSIVPHSEVTNEVYGTSGMPLSYSDRYATGASFEAVDMTSSNAIYVDGGGNANSRYGRGQVAAQSAAVYYNKLTSAGVPVKAQGYDLFVRAAVSGTAILPANDVILQKAVAVNDGTYATNDTAALLNVQFGDTVSYRLRVKTPASADTKGLKLYDLLPCSGDVRGTAWSTSLLNQLRPTGTYAVFRGDTDITAQVSVASTTIALADTKEAVRQASYDKAGIVADATAVCFDFGSAAIGGNSVVEAVFELKVCEPGSSASANDTSAPTSQDPAADHAALLSANALKTAGNTFDADLPLYQGASFLTTFMLKGTDPVNIRLMPEPAHIAGFVWEDRNLNGRWADAPAGTAATIVSEQTSSPDVAKPGVTVRLHKYVNNTEVFPVFAPAQGYWALTITSDGTATKADGSLIATGSYVFENLESSYGTGGASEVRYSVEVVNPSSADTTYYFTTKGAGTNSTLDSDVYGRESDGSQHANSGWSDSFVVNTAAAVDAGLYQKSRISGLVWEDINDNGVQDTSEPGIGSVVVKLQKSSDNGVSWSDYTMTTTSVAGSGAYSFDALELPYGDTSLYRAVFDKGAVTNKAYTYKWASVYDGNNDKAKFDVLPCTDDLTVASADRKVRYALAGPNISLGYATTVQDYDAGITPEGKYIAGYIWEDTNDDGLSNDTSYDLPMRNLTVRLYVDDFDRAEYDNYAQPIATTVSDAFGCYRFFDATDGGLSHALTLDALGRPLAIDFSKTYQVEFELPSGSQWAFVSAKVGSDDTIDSDVTPPGVDNTTTTRAVSQLIGGSAATTFAIVDCGMMQTSTISGKIWFDTDDNGSQVGENFSTKPAPVTVELYQQGQGDVWAKVATTTTTSADARFSFGGLRSGNYKLGFDRSGLVSDTLSYKWALPHAAAAGFDSDALYASRVDDTAETALISLSYYTSLIDQDAGITPYAHITGFAWLDDDRNGARNAGETPFANVRVHLLDSTSSQPVATTLTDATGSYMFDDLLPSASFKVAFINPSAVDYSFTTAGVHHKATNLIASPLGSTYENYFSAGHTHFINLATHSNSELNSGFYLIPNHTVTYVPNGGSASWGSGDFSITIKEGRLVPNQAVSSATATFLGWFVGPDNTSLWDFVAQRMPAHDVVLTAQWEQEPVAPPVVTTYYHLIYDANGGSGNVPMDATDYTPGDAVALADGTGLSCEGCSFQGWALTVQGPPITNFNITADTTVYAQWLPLAVDEATSLVTSAPSTSTRTFFDDFIASLFGTDIPTINLGGVEIPLAAAPGEAAWALLNLVMLILGALLSLLSFGLYFRKRTSEVQSDKNGKERTQEGSGDSGDLKRKRLTWRILSLALAVIALILFLLVEDLTLKMVLIDLWTPLFMVILILQIVFTVVGKRRKTVKAGEDKDGRLAPPMYGKTPTAV